MTSDEFRALLAVYSQLQHASPDLAQIHDDIENILCAAHRERVRPVAGEYGGRLDCVRRFKYTATKETDENMLTLARKVIDEDTRRMREASND